MDDITFIVIGGIISMNVVAFIIGYQFGKHNERVAWNDLIKEGKLPRPFERRA